MIRKFESTLGVCRELYNAALEERSKAWKMNRQSLNYYDQCAQLKDIRAMRGDVNIIYAKVLQEVLRKADKTFAAFFRRNKSGEKAGYPRFKNQAGFNSFTYSQKGFWIKGKKLSLSKIGTCRLFLSRPVEGKIKTCTIKLEADGWYVIFAVEENQSPFYPKTGDTVGVDLGITSFAVLSTGEVIENPKYPRTAERRLKTAQRSVTRKQKRSGNRKKAIVLLAKQHLKVKRQRLDFFHKTSLQLVREFDTVIYEDLNIAGLLKNHCLAKSIFDAAWNTFLTIDFAKAASAGRIREKVPAQYSSQDCSDCGARMKLSLAIRVFRCTECGNVKGRDHNAAINIKQRGTLCVDTAVVNAVNEARTA